MEALHQFISPAIARIVRPAPLSNEKVLFAWRMAVGAAVARISHVSLGSDRVMVIALEDARWFPELDRSASVILSRLQEVLGDDVLERIELRSPPVPAAGRRRTGRTSSRKKG